MNALRGDVFRLGRCVEISTGEGTEETEDHIPRVKPFKYTYEKEIVLYAKFKALQYHAVECLYAPNAFRGHVRELIKGFLSFFSSSLFL
jgi:cytoplasmic tRNA 2-thiolation protein 1